MRIKAALKWSAITVTVVALVTVGGCVYQVRKPPVGNASYVALGSSFAAGFGLGPRIPGTPVISQRTYNGYPQQLARLLHVLSFTDMSSAGSTVQHVLSGGQFMLPPQIDALGPATRLVTITAGGNDIAYVGDLTGMAYRNRGGLAGAILGRGSGSPKSVAQRDFSALAVNLKATLLEIRRRSPNAQVIVVTYPQILPSRGTCSALGLTPDQAALMSAVGEKLAETTRVVAHEASVDLVDMAVLSAGHDACSVEPWVNGFKPRNGADFHPTLAGAHATAEAVKRALKSS